MDKQLREKLNAVKLVALDVDGVLTDGKAFYGSDGFEGLSFNVQDGSGIKYLQRCGVEVALITGRTVEAVAARAEVLGIEHVYQGAKVKREAWDALKSDTGLEDEAICYVGDDLPDIPVLRRAGVAVAVANARPEVREVAEIITAAPGGEGAVRELAEMILKARGEWQEVLGRYLDQ